MTITGKDTVSLNVLNALSNGIRVKDIPAKYNISLDQAKRLSRYHSMLVQISTNLDEQAVLKFKKVLFTAPFSRT